MVPKCSTSPLTPGISKVRPYGLVAGKANKLYPSSQKVVGCIMTAVGIIGVGYIGKLLLDELLDADYTVTVFDIDESQVKYATDRGAAATETPGDVDRKSVV